MYWIECHWWNDLYQTTINNNNDDDEKKSNNNFKFKSETWNNDFVLSCSKIQNHESTLLMISGKKNMIEKFINNIVIIIFHLRYCCCCSIIIKCKYMKYNAIIHFIIVIIFFSLSLSFYLNISIMTVIHICQFLFSWIISHAYIWWKTWWWWWNENHNFHNKWRIMAVKHILKGSFENEYHFCCCCCWIMKFEYCNMNK